MSNTIKLLKVMRMNEILSKLQSLSSNYYYLSRCNQFLCGFITTLSVIWQILRKMFKPWSGGSVGWNVVLYNKNMGVQFLVTAHTWAADSTPNQDLYVRQPIDISFSYWCFSFTLMSLSLSVSLSLSISLSSPPHL